MNNMKWKRKKKRKKEKKQIKKKKKLEKINKSIYIYTKSLNQITHKNRTTKIYTRTATTSYLETRTCDRCSTLKHILWVPNTQSSLGNVLNI